MVKNNLVVLNNYNKYTVVANLNVKLKNLKKVIFITKRQKMVHRRDCL